MRCPPARAGCGTNGSNGVITAAPSILPAAPGIHWRVFFPGAAARMNVRHLALLLAVIAPVACTAAPDQPPAAAPAAPAVDVVELGAADAQARMTAGTLTARALTDAYLARIAAIDQAGPALQVGDRSQRHGRGRGRGASTPSAGPAGCADRCTASPCCSRTTSTSSAWPTRPARWPWPATSRPRTRSSWRGCARPARSSSARPT